jgi:hypothetical protein
MCGHGGVGMHHLVQAGVRGPRTRAKGLIARSFFLGRGSTCPARGKLAVTGFVTVERDTRVHVECRINDVAARQVL